MKGVMLALAHGLVLVRIVTVAAPVGKQAFRRMEVRR